jgi:hypothetical protein
VVQRNLEIKLTATIYRLQKAKIIELIVKSSSLTALTGKHNENLQKTI